MNITDVALFGESKVRKVWFNDQWYFSVIDVVGVLSESIDPRNYWKVLKIRLKAEGSEVVTNCNQLKMVAEDGKMRETDCGDTETIFRLIQSIPSPKAEPLKLWLAKVGYERIQEITDPVRSIDRARDNWKIAGRSEKRIQQRMMGQETRNKLTDYRQDHEVKKGDEFAILTNIIHQEWTGLSVKEHKNLKDLKSHNLRDHMSEAELIFTALAELSTRQIAETDQTIGLEENKVPAKKGGQIAKNARKELENQTGKNVITGANFLSSKKKEALNEIKSSGMFDDIDE